MLVFCLYCSAVSCSEHCSNDTIVVIVYLVGFRITISIFATVLKFSNINFIFYTSKLVVQLADRLMTSKRMTSNDIERCYPCRDDTSRDIFSGIDLFVPSTPYIHGDVYKAFEKLNFCSLPASSRHSRQSVTHPHSLV